MRVCLALLIGLLGLLGSSCSLLSEATSSVFSSSAECLDDWAERQRNQAWAKSAWKQVQQESAPHKPSKDYRDGFLDGFTEFLYQGGNGEPPPLPPRQYRKIHYQTPEGYQAIEDWFAGYRHGARVAGEGGYRRWVTGPTSLGAAPLAAGPLPAEMPPPELLPAPRNVHPPEPGLPPPPAPAAPPPAPMPPAAPEPAKPSSSRVSIKVKAMKPQPVSTPAIPVELPPKPPAPDVPAEPPPAPQNRPPIVQAPEPLAPPRSWNLLPRDSRKQKQ